MGLLCLTGVGLPADPAYAQARYSVSGAVVDASGAAVPRAEVTVLDAQGMAARATLTDDNGRFSLAAIHEGSHLLRVRAAGFGEHRMALSVRGRDVAGLTITLDVAAVEEAVTVTAEKGRAEPAVAATQAVNVIRLADIWQRAGSAVAEVATEEAGIHLQRTSPTIAGVFVRGLTGNKVNVFVDGVRYSTGAQRGGISTFLGLIEPASLESVEVLRGPNSAQYGSDALGGSLQFLSATPAYASDGRELRGSTGTFFDTGFNGYGTNLSATYAGRTFALAMTGAARRGNRIRPGGGIDSHAAVTRFLGLRSDRLMGARLPGTEFTQFGGVAHLAWSPTASSRISLQYRRGQQEHGKRYDQLLGGDGNLVADLNHLTLDLFHVRYMTAAAGWFDQATLTYSFNTQREERVNQGGTGNPRAAITHEPERTSVHGIQAFATRAVGSRHELMIGGEIYPERVDAPSFAVDPATGASTVRRGRVPDNATFRSGGAYVQDAFEIMPGRLRFVGSVRYSAEKYRARASDAPQSGGRPLWPDDALDDSDVTFRAGLNATLSQAWTLYGSVSRGFRAPHITDLGTLGLTGAGFEVAAPDLAGLQAAVGTTAGSGAVSTGVPVRQVEPETSLTYEIGARLRRSNLKSDLSFFVNDIHDNIQKQALILPPGAVGLRLGGEPIVAQGPTGTVFVAASPNPVLVRVNFDNARIFGVEHSFEWKMTKAWSVGTIATYLHSRDTATDLPPNIEGGTPAPELYVRLQYAPAGSRFWIEPFVHAAARQDALSSLDLEDRRTGAARSRTSIRNFFLNGATARGWVDPGPDERAGTVDDFLIATGETLTQIQDRVLGPGVQSSSLFTAVPGYVTLNARGGVRFGKRHEVIVQLQNLGDRNYRGISWGVDAPGRSVSVRYRTTF